MSETVKKYFKQCNDFYSINENEERDFNVGWKMKYSGSGSHRSNLTYSRALSVNSNSDAKDRQRRALRLRGDKKDGSKTLVSGGYVVIKIDPKYKLSNGMIKSNPLHWIYHTATDLRGFPYVGRFTIYSGGGYVAELIEDIGYATAVAAALKQDYWLDTYTRAIFFEFTAFSVNTQYFATAFIIAEVIPTGQIVPKGEIRVFRLNRYDGAGGKLILASEAICFLLLFFFVYREIRHISQIGIRLYFKGFWCWIELVITLALFSGTILWALRWYQEDKTMILLQQNSRSFINFQYVAAADEAFNKAVTVIVFFSILKLAKFLSFFPMLVILKGTIRKSLKPLVNYSVPFTIAFVAFLLFASLKFY